jgi:hypothetical protein
MLEHQGPRIALSETKRVDPRKVPDLAAAAVAAVVEAALHALVPLWPVRSPVRLEVASDSV